ncbi:MAG: CBS domain-containing protein [Planctomycetaceae bacterium]|nr:CBS domain-containing protein [Planctomycetaceae bacterium]
MSVGAICVRAVDTASANETVLQAARRMHDRKVGTLVVLDNSGEPIGLVTDRDLAVRVLAATLDPTQTMVADIMTPHPETIHEHAPIEEALRVMRAGKFRRVPVVDARQKLVGLLSLDDVLALLAEEFREIGSLVADESPRSLAGR